MKTDGILHFTNDEEAEIRELLINFIRRVSGGQCTTTETSMMPFLVNVMFPDVRALKMDTRTTTH